MTILPSFPPIPISPFISVLSSCLTLSNTFKKCKALSISNLKMKIAFRIPDSFLKPYYFSSILSCIFPFIIFVFTLKINFPTCVAKQIVRCFLQLTAHGFLGMVISTLPHFLRKFSSVTDTVCHFCHFSDPKTSRSLQHLFCHTINSLCFLPLHH